MDTIVQCCEADETNYRIAHPDGDKHDDEEDGDEADAEDEDADERDGKRGGAKAAGRPANGRGAMAAAPVTPSSAAGKRATRSASQAL